jgi:hypothetical protein
VKIDIPKELEFLREYFTEDNIYQVKLGGFKDGGYVSDYRSILNSDILISGGVGSNVRFESDFYEINNKLKVILIDPTVSILRMFVRSFYHFTRKEQSGFRSLSEVFNYLYFKNKSTLIKKYLNTDFNISSLLNKFSCKKNSVFLKLDIEGFEFELLDNIILNKQYFTGVCIEFHNLEIFENYSKLNSFVKALEFQILNISVNEVCLNKDGFPSVLEISFLPKSDNNWPKSFNKEYYLQNSNALNTEMVILDI